MPSLEELLQRVIDRDTFVVFLEALAYERAAAAEVERASPDSYLVDGAYRWKNIEVEGFLFAALRYFDPGPYHQPESEPSWHAFAEILWFGKNIE